MLRCTHIRYGAVLLVHASQQHAAGRARVRLALWWKTFTPFAIARRPRLVRLRHSTASLTLSQSQSCTAISNGAHFSALMRT
jgi:hypothetical protein